MKHAHFSKATIAGHPIHPMVVGFPIAFYTAGVASLVAYVAGASRFWVQASVYLLFAGLVTAGIAASIGLVDLIKGIPRDTPARRTGLSHMGLHVLATILFAGAAVMLWYRWRTQIEPTVVAPLVISAIGLGVTVAAGTLGWKLVHKHHVGLDEETERHVPEVAPGLLPPPVFLDERSRSDARRASQRPL